MSEARKSNGVIKLIIVGVATTVLTSMILFHLGLEGQVSVVEQSNSTNDIQLKTSPISATAEKGLAANILTKSASKSYSEVSDDNLPVLDIDGYWVDPRTQATYYIQQQNAYFTFQEISYGSVSAEGQGNLKGSSAQYTYTTFMGTEGDGSYKLDPTGKRITATFTDHYTGVTQTIFMQRK